MDQTILVHLFATKHEVLQEQWVFRRFGGAAGFQPHSRSGLRPEGLGGRAGQHKKCGNGRSDSTGIRQTSEVAFSATQLGWLMTRESGHCSWTTRNAEIAVQTHQDSFEIWPQKKALGYKTFYIQERMLCYGCKEVLS
ncbi:hypothetical protein ACSFXN_10600 [Planococcus sp. 1R117A]|uniref:hypothetical protein n=1 Tax=Planococcus sp. 1R117A TaxID=3447020 RepID=UPI003EDC890C